MNIKKILTVAVVALFAAVATEAQVAKFQALFLYQFAKNTSWPLEDAGQSFVITIVGDASVATELRALVANKSVGQRKVEVVETNTAADIEKSSIVYVGKSHMGSLARIVKEQADQKSLVVSASSGMCAKGASISFVPDGGRLNYEICESTIRKSGLKVTPKLVSLGKVIKL